MKRYLKKLIAFVLSTLLIPASLVLAETPQEKGWQIAKKVDNLPSIERMTSEAIFKIYDAQDKLVFTKKSRAASFMENYSDPENKLSRSISYFFAPADDKGNAALMIEKPGDEDDNQWIYLKGLRKPKRVIGSDKSSSFMGSDFSNGDVAARDINDSTYTWLASESINFKGKKIQTEKILVEFKDQKMREDYGTSKMISWIHPKTGLIFKGEVYDLNGQLSKKMRLLSFTTKKNRDGKRVFMVTGMEMKSVLKGTKTVMNTKNIRVEKQTKKVSPSMFNVSYLTRKWW
jgi:Outer membrane lipoprotein-sorting protein